MSPSVHTLEDRVSSWLSGWLAKQRLSTAFHVEPLAGDGSPRPFYRIRIPHKTFVLLCEPAWTLSKDYPPLQAELKQRGMAVPEFFAVDEKLGVLLMEDVGDELLQMRLLSKPGQKKAWMEKATVLIAQLHASTFPVDPRWPVSQRRFDAEKYEQELAFTYEHLVEGLFKGKPASQELKKSIRQYCERLEKMQPLVFCHRDYHTRNLLVHNEELRLIDFQDARLGPPEYDLASLFFDSYVPVEKAERTALMNRYLVEVMKHPLGKKIEISTMPERLHLVAFQRVVKAAGSFASFYTRYGKKTHLPYLKPALEMAASLQKELGNKVPALPITEWQKSLQKVPL